MGIIILVGGIGFLLLSHSPTNPSQSIHPTPTASHQPSVVPSLSPVTNQYEFTASDSGKVARYPLTSRFGIVLNGEQYPKSALSITCSSKDVLGPISNIPAVPRPLYAVRFEGINPGNCTLQNHTFFIKVEITQ